MVRESLPSDSTVDLGEFSLSLSSQFRPVLRFAPVTFTRTGTGAEISVDALEIGVSPLQALFGQPGASVSLIAPRVQIVQDLLGPRLAAFSTSEDPDTGEERWSRSTRAAIPIPKCASMLAACRSAAGRRAATASASARTMTG